MSEQRILQMPRRSYCAKLFRIAVGNQEVQVAGTLDGFIDLALPEGTYQITPQQASGIAAALLASVEDVHKNCLYDNDALLEAEKEK